MTDALTEIQRNKKSLWSNITTAAKELPDTLPSETGIVESRER